MTEARTGSAERIAVGAVGVMTLVFLAIPLVVVSLASLNPGTFFTFPPTGISARWYDELVRSEDWRSSLFFTLTIGVVSAAGATVVGTLAALSVTRLPGRLRPVGYAILVAPMVVPVIVLAISYYRVVLELHLIGNLATFIVADMMVTTPLAAMFVVGACLNLDPSLERASLSCGAGPWRTLGRVTLPTVAPAAAAGFMVAFLFAIDEVVMSMFLVAPGKTPLAVRMFLEIQQGTAPIVTAVATFLIFMTIAAIGLFVIARNLRSGAKGVLSGPRSGALDELVQDRA